MADGCVLKFNALVMVLSMLPYYLIGKQSNCEHGCSKLFYEHESPSLEGPSNGWPLLDLLSTICIHDVHKKRKEDLPLPTYMHMRRSNNDKEGACDS